MPTIKENLVRAREIIAAHDKFDLSQFARNTGCGTLYCGAGLLGTIDEFKEQGIVLVGRGNPSSSDCYSRTMPCFCLSTDYPNKPCADYVFGDNCFLDLFAERGYGTYDCIIFNEIDSRGGLSAAMSDKDLLLARFDFLLAHSE